MFHIQNLALSNRLKLVKMSHNIIKQVVQYCDTHVDKNAATREVIMTRIGNGGFYYCIIAKYAAYCRKEKGLPSADGLPCYECRAIIYERQECVSMAKSHGKKYFHPDCARKLNIIE